MHICLISDGQMRTPEPNSGGLQKVVHDLGRMLVLSGHEVTLVAAQGSALEGANVVGACPPMLGNLSGTEAAIAQAAEQVKCDLYLDVSHTHKTAYTHYKNSIILHEDTTPVERHPCVVFISDAQRKHCYRWKHNARVIPNRLIPPQTYRYLPQGPLGASQHDVAIFLGNIVHHKGAHLAIELARRAGIKLWVAGPLFSFSSFAAQYCQRVLSLCDDKQIFYIGALNEQEKYRCLAQARMTLCCPNQSFINYVEPAQLVAIESGFVGTPVLSSANGGMRDYVLPGAGRCERTLRGMLKALPDVWDMKTDLHYAESVIMRSVKAAFDLMANREQWLELIEERSRRCE